MADTSGEAFSELATLAAKLVDAEHAAQVTQAKLNRLQSLVLTLRRSDGLTLRAEHHSFGLDRYVCPVCGASKQVTSALDFCNDVYKVDHESTCALVALREEIDSW